jgi:hypothetical protein
MLVNFVRGSRIHADLPRIVVDHLRILKNVAGPQGFL